MILMSNYYDEQPQEKVKNLRIIDDTLFRLIAARKEVCQEILRTLLDDDKLEVVSVVPQETMVTLFRGITLDALCRLGDGTLCNIEMQKSDSNDDIKRVRFHASLVTANNTPKSTRFKEIPSVKILYITEYDALKNGQSVTHVSRCQKVKNKFLPLNDGEDIIFANTAVKTKDKYSKLLQLFLKKESFYDEEYPHLSKAIQHFKDTKKGRDEMCAVMEEYANERALESAVEATIKTCIKFNASREKTLQTVLEEYPQMSEQHISERIAELWDEK